MLPKGFSACKYSHIFLATSISIAFLDALVEVVSESKSNTFLLRLARVQLFLGLGETELIPLKNLHLQTGTGLLTTSS